MLEYLYIPTHTHFKGIRTMQGMVFNVIVEMT